MSVYRSDVLSEQIAELHALRNTTEGMGYFDEAEYDRLSKEMLAVEKELEELLAGPDKYLLQREWLERQQT